MADYRRGASSNPNSADSTPALPALGFDNSSPSFGLSFIQPPATPPTTRAGYSRVGNDATDRHAPPTIAEEEEEDIADSFRRQGSGGLGIAVAGDSPTLGSGAAIPPRVRNAGSAPMSSPDITLSPPGTSGPFLGRFPHDSAEITPDLARERFSPYTGTYEEFQRGLLGHAQTNASTTDFQQYLHTSDTQQLRGAPSIQSAFENNGFHPGHECQTRRDFYHSRFSWLNGTLIFICLLSTVLSGIFLGLALRAPRYGRYISTSDGATMRPATAILWTSIIAKIVELSFVTGFVAFLGQVLSRRAFSRIGGGVTLSELSMWRWVVQPGTLITHWETAKYAGLSFLGMLSLLSAILATLYAPAATALVQPMLKNGYRETKVMAGSVKSDFANIKYIQDMCQTPITTDPQYGGTTCTQIEHAGQGFYNYHKYLADWDNEAKTGNSSSDQIKRPLGFGLLYENTTITAQWIDIINTTEVSKEHGRVINNVSLAMPHAGVFAAARDQRNGILQPEELDSEGTYLLEASVPSPVMKVLCVNMKESELAPLVYTEWPNAELVNATTWTPALLMAHATTTNTTVVDDIFGWTKQDNKTMRDYPPVFARFPKPFNTILNNTSAYWGRSAIYLMGQGGDGTAGPDMSGIYSVCKIDIDITPYCSTRYMAGGSGGKMEALCGDPLANTVGDMAYINSVTNATLVRGYPNWRDVGTDWSNSLSLGTGISDGEASNSRLLMQLQLVPTDGKEADPDNLDVKLNPLLPSMSEAIAVLSGCTLLKSFIDAPFVSFWNYTVSQLEAPQTQYFNATIVAQQYASGGVDNPSKAWTVILLLVFLMNIFVLVYFIFHRGLVTDFSEPPNLFALAVNSPPSQALAGSCGGGPEGKQYMVNWFVNHEGEHLYMEPGEKTALLAGHVHPHVHSHDHGASQQKQPEGSGFISKITAALGSMRLPFGTKTKAPAKTSQPAGTERLRPLSMVGSTHSRASPSEYELEDGETRTQRQYAKLSKRRSML